MHAERRLSPVRRLDLEDETLTLAARAIRRGHPKADALAHFQPSLYDDEGLMEVAFRLASWLAKQER